MSANVNNALYFLVSTLFDLVLWVWMLRILLQIVRADFYNPISQLIWRITRVPADQLRPLLPRLQRVDLASIVVLIALALAYVPVIDWLLNQSRGIASIIMLGGLKILWLLINLYTFTLFVQAILSWIGPGVNNPASNILWSLNEPLLRRVRRFLPQLAGLDISPLAVLLALQVLSQLLGLPAIFR